MSLGFLLVFRTDWAYDRYYEGKASLGQLYGGMRNLNVLFVNFLRENRPGECAAFARARAPPTWTGGWTRAPPSAAPTWARSPRARARAPPPGRTTSATPSARPPSASRPRDACVATERSSCGSQT